MSDEDFLPSFVAAVIRGPTELEISQRRCHDQFAEQLQWSDLGTLSFSKHSCLCDHIFDGRHLERKAMCYDDLWKKLKGRFQFAFQF